MKPAWIKRGKHWRKCEVIERSNGFVRWRTLRGREIVTLDTVRFEPPTDKDRPVTPRQLKVLAVLKTKPMTPKELISKTGTTHYSIRVLTARGLLAIGENGLLRVI